MACNCVKTVNEQLAKANGELSIGFGMTKDMGIITRLIIGTVKKDKSKRDKPPIVSATFCPFCGTKFDGCAMAGAKAVAGEPPAK
jgi:copper chaperone CopZ